MYPIKSPCFLTLVFVYGFLILTIPGIAQKTISDTNVERMMNQCRFKEVSKLITAKLKGNSALDIDHRLYYSNRLSIAQFRLRNVDSALVVAFESLALSTKSKDSTLIVDAWKAMAYCYNHAGHLDSALYFTEKMMFYGERNHDDKLTRNALASMATILSQNKRYEDALLYNRKANQLTMKLKDSSNFASGKYNLGLTFLNLNQTDSCLFYLNQAALIAEKLHVSDHLIYIYGTMADCYLQLKKDKERKKYLLMANAIAEKIGNKQFLAMGYSNLTHGALDEHNYNEAIVYGQKALDLLRLQPLPVLKMKVDSMMYVSYKQTGKFPEAFAFLESYMFEKEKLMSENQTEKLNELVVELQVPEKDLTIANQKLDITRKKLNMRVLTLVVVIVLLLLCGQFIFILKTRKFRNTLFIKEKDIDRQTMEIHTWLKWRQNETTQPGAGIGSIAHAEDIPDDVAVFNSKTFLFTELREVFDTQKLFLDPELNLKTVTRILGTNQKYLYQAISENSDTNFRSFLNRYRVDEAKKTIEQKIRGKEELNLSELYASSGFHSPVSFYRAFKSVTGLTPKDYAAEIRNEVRKGI
jgi:AraC-like DNA-binding protein